MADAPDTIPVDQFTPDQQSPQGAKASAQSDIPDTIPVSQFQSDEDKYGTVPEMLKTAAEQFASGATLGTSQLAENAIYHNPKERALRAQANPVTSFLSNMAGGAAAIGLTGGLAAPAEAGALGMGASGLAARALGYGAEGAVFGAGNVISDYALGDPNLNAQKVLANVGTGALFGGLLGAAHYGVVGGKIADTAAEANAAAKTTEALKGADGTAFSPPSNGGGDSSFIPIKANAQKAIDAAQKEGLPLPFAFVSASKNDQNLYNMLVETAPSVSGTIAQKELAEGIKNVQGKLENILNVGGEFAGQAPTKAELGTALRNSFIAEIKQDNAPVDAMFKTLKDSNIYIPVDSSEASKVMNAIKDLPEARLKGVGSNIANQVLENIPLLRSADEISQYASSLRGELEGMAPGNKKYVVGRLQDMLNGLYESSVTKAAKNPELPEEMQQIMGGLIDDWKNAKAASGEVHAKFNPVMEQLGAKTGYGFGAKSMISQLEDMNVEDIVNRTFDKKNSAFNAHLAEKLPIQAALIRDYQKQILREASLLKDGSAIDPNVVFKKVFGQGQTRGMEPEIREAIFPKDQLESMERLHTWYRNIPTSANPSRTSFISALGRYFENPLSAATQEARDFGITAYLKARSMLAPGLKGNPFVEGAMLGDKFNKMQAIAKVTQEVDDSIVQKSRQIFSKKDALRGAALSGAAIGADKSYDKIVKDVVNVAENPAGIPDHMAGHMQGLQQALPNINQSLHNTSIAALSFLNSKLPRPAMGYPMTAPYKPSEAEKTKFMRYYDAVNNPVGVLDQVKHGIITNEALEALQTVHPDLLQQMQKQVAGQMQSTNPKKVPYAVRMSVAKFLGTPLDASMTPQAIIGNQMSLSGPQLGTQQAPNTGRRGTMKALNQSSLVKTQTQDDASDTK